jgi:hypothetical protein
MHGTLEHNWTEARVTSLRQFIVEKYSASQAAFELGISRNAAIGKAARLGLNFESQHAKNMYRADRPRVRDADRPVQVRRVPTKVAPLPPMAPEPNARNLTLMELQSDECHYIVTADSPFLYCGHPIQKGYAYCEHHKRIVWVPPTARQRKPSWTR